MNINYADLFHALHPNFFAAESIRSLPPEDILEEQILDLRAYQPDQLSIPCPAGITFGMYHGDMAALHAAVSEVDEDWVQYFSKGDHVYCAFNGDKVVSFCLLDEFGQYEGLRIGGPGCVGTIPAYRKLGIGLKMVQNATVILRQLGYDFSYIHYTHVGHWYARLGYQTILRWNAHGLMA